ncbi:ATP synthase F0 subunit B [Thermodesulfobacteriota bacterium]
MKTIKRMHDFCLCGAILALGTHLTGGLAWAEEGTGEWRTHWDEMMLWINFAILAFVLIKYLRKPVKEFLDGRKYELAREIKKVEEEKQAIGEKIKETEKLLDESSIRFAGIKERIIEQGEREKTRIIQEAREQSRLMLESAQRKIDSHFQQAQNRIREELVDAAVNLAIEKLPHEIDARDNQKFVEQFLSASIRN